MHNFFSCEYIRNIRNKKLGPGDLVTVGFSRSGWVWLQYVKPKNKQKTHVFKSVTKQFIKYKIKINTCTSSS